MFLKPAMCRKRYMEEEYWPATGSLEGLERAFRQACDPEVIETINRMIGIVILNSIDPNLEDDDGIQV